MIPTDNKSPKVSELIEELQRCDQDQRIRLIVGYAKGFEIVGTGPVFISRHTIPCGDGLNTVVEIHQDVRAE